MSPDTDVPQQAVGIQAGRAEFVALASGGGAGGFGADGAVSRPTTGSTLTLVHRPILGTGLTRWADEAACAASARRLAACADVHDAFITLEGPLGAGKTTFVRHLLRALGVTGRIKSPTYAVLEPHQAGTLAIAHFDFYRFEDPREWEDAGFRDAFDRPGLNLAEWPDKAAGALPCPDLRLTIQPDDQGPEEAREVVLEAFSPRGLGLLEAWEGR